MSLFLLEYFESVSCIEDQEIVYVNSAFSKEKDKKNEENNHQVL